MNGPPKIGSMSTKQEKFNSENWSKPTQQKVNSSEVNSSKLEFTKFELNKSQLNKWPIEWMSIHQSVNSTTQQKLPEQMPKISNGPVI